MARTSKTDYTLKVLNNAKRQNVNLTGLPSYNTLRSFSKLLFLGLEGFSPLAILASLYISRSNANLEAVRALRTNSDAIMMLGAMTPRVRSENDVVVYDEEAVSDEGVEESE